MKKLFWFGLLLVILVSSAQAFVPNAELQLRSQRINVFLRSNTTAEITIESTWFNDTATEQTTSFLFPLKKSAEKVSLFVDSAGIPFERFSDQKKLEKLWEKIVEAKETQLFQWGDPAWEQVLVSDSITWAPKAEKTVKFTFTAPLSGEQGWNSLTLPQDRKKIADFFEFSFQAPNQNLKHFLHNLPLGGWQEKTSDGFTYLFKQENIRLLEPLQLLWTDRSSAELKTGDFIAVVLPPPAQKNFEQVVLLLDASGSMSDNAWPLAQELVREVFDIFPSEQSFQVRFFSNELEQLPFEGFQKNSRDFQKMVLEKMEYLRPVGKTNLAGVFDELPSNSLILLVTDETDLELPEDQNDWVVFHFNPNDELATQMKLQQKFWQPLWRHTGTFEQRYLVKDKIRNIGHPLQKTADFLPSVITHFSSVTEPLFVQRQPDGLSRGKFDIFPRYWARQRIAELLSEPVLSTNVLDAILAIGRVFGVETDLFGPATTRTELQKKLAKKSVQDQQLAVMDLQVPVFFKTDPDVQIRKEKPFYYAEVEELWRQFDWYDRVGEDRLVKIAPFSEAQKELFLNFPEIFANFFSVGTETEFCDTLRCFSIQAGNRIEPKLSDRAFLRDFEPQHWANGYLLELLNKEILQPDEQGQLFPDQAITRAEFVRLVVEYFEIPFKKSADFLLPFTDVSPENPASEAIDILRSREVINGYEGNVFEPSQSLTRAEAVKILLAANNTVGEVLSKDPIFQDAQGWERPWVEAAYDRNIIRGAEKNSQKFFEPHRPLTRAEAAKIITQFR